jgi:hypothetical protein
LGKTITNLFNDFQQAEDLRDLDDKENISLRKEQAPLLEPLEPKDVSN